MLLLRAIDERVSPRFTVWYKLAEELADEELAELLDAAVVVVGLIPARTISRCPILNIDLDDILFSLHRVDTVVWLLAAILESTSPLLTV